MTRWFQSLVCSILFLFPTIAAFSGTGTPTRAFRVVLMIVVISFFQPRPVFVQMDPEQAVKPLTEWEEADKRQFEAIQKNLTDRVETMLTIVEKLR